MKVRLEVEAEFKDEQDLADCINGMEAMVGFWSVDRGDLEVWYRGEKHDG